MCYSMHGWNKQENTVQSLKLIELKEVPDSDKINPPCTYLIDVLPLDILSPHKYSC